VETNAFVSQRSSGTIRSRLDDALVGHRRSECSALDTFELDTPECENEGSSAAAIERIVTGSMRRELDV
jgi:hypothetical protein